MARSMFQAAPRIAKGKPETASERHRYRAVVGTYLLSAKVLLEPVDSGVFRYGFVLEKPAPVVAFYSHLLEPQHFLPMQPAIGAPDQGSEVVFLVSETRTRVLEPCRLSIREISVPDQRFTVPGGRREHELAGLAGGEQPVRIGGPE